MTEPAKVAVITLNWNGAAFLQECVDSVLDSDYANFCLLVVDNGSADTSLQLLDECYKNDSRVIVLKNSSNLGYSRGMNAGLKYGFGELNADYCLVMNNDTRLDRSAISALVVLALQDPQTAFVTGKVYYYDKPDTFQTVGKQAHPILVNGGHIGRGEQDKGQYDRDSELAFCDDIFWLVSRKVYAETGGYDPEFFLQAEDFDWQLRAKNAGFKIMYAHQAKLWHKESMTLGKMSPRKIFYDTRNPVIAVIKNCAPDVVRRYLRKRVYSVLLPSMVKSILKGRLSSGLAIGKGLFSILWWRATHSGSSRQGTKL